MTNTMINAKHMIFEGKEDFEAFSKAEAFLRKNGFSYGSMERGNPIGIMKGEYSIAKWRNLDRQERDELHGQMTTETSFRSGPIYVDIYDDAPADVEFTEAA